MITILVMINVNMTSAVVKSLAQTFSRSEPLAQCGRLQATNLRFESRTVPLNAMPNGRRARRAKELEDPAGKLTAPSGYSRWPDKYSNDHTFTSNLETPISQWGYGEAKQPDKVHINIWVEGENFECVDPEVYDGWNSFHDQGTCPLWDVGKIKGPVLGHECSRQHDGHCQLMRHCMAFTRKVGDLVRALQEGFEAVVEAIEKAKEKHKETLKKHRKNISKNRKSK